GRRDGPLERPDRRAGDRVVPALDLETPGRPGEPAGPARDGGRLLDVDDAGDVRRVSLTGELGVHGVAVGRGKLVGPDRRPGRGVDQVRDVHGEPTQQGRGPRAVNVHEHERRRGGRPADVPFQLAVEWDLV